MRAVATASARAARPGLRGSGARGVRPPSRRFGDRARSPSRGARDARVSRESDDRVGSEPRAIAARRVPRRRARPHPRKRGRTSPSAPPSVYDLSEEDARASPSSWPRDVRADAPRADDTADARPRGFDRRDAPPPPPRPEPSLADQLPDGVGAVVAWILRARCPPPRTLPPAPSPASSRGPCPSPPCAPSPTSYGHASSSPYSSDSSPRSCSSADSPLLAIAVANGESMGAKRGGGQ